MPPFREGPIIVDPGFSPEALYELRDAGHERRVNIVDASYDIPEGARVIKFPRSSAEALLGIVRLIPVENNEVTIMVADPNLSGHIFHEANALFHTAITAFESGVSMNDLAKMTNSELEELDRDDSMSFGIGERCRKDEDVLLGLLGFYSIAANPSERHTFFRTVDDLPFACASLVVGHSQRTE